MKQRRFKLIAIVEGHGEQDAVPILMEKWFQHRSFLNFSAIAPAVRAAGCGALKAAHDGDESLGVEHYVEIALAASPDGILVMIDADDECRTRTGRQEKLGPELLRRATSVSRGVPVGVVVAHPEYEIWFLAAAATFRRAGLFVSSERIEQDLSDEVLRGCKGTVARLMDKTYEETVHQPLLTAHLPFHQSVRRLSRSYDKLLRELDKVCQAARRT